MFIKLHKDGNMRDVWYASTDDGQYDAVASEPLAAVMNVAQHLEEECAKYLEDDDTLYLIALDDNFPLYVGHLATVLERLREAVERGAQKSGYRMYRLTGIPLYDN